MKTMTTYGETERIGWYRDGLIWRRVKTERPDDQCAICGDPKHSAKATYCAPCAKARGRAQRKAILSEQAQPADPKPVVKAAEKPACSACGGPTGRKKAKRCISCVRAAALRCECGQRVKDSTRQRCHSCIEKGRTMADSLVVEAILGGEWRMDATRADRAEVVKRWTGSNAELARLTGWNVWRIIRSAKKEAS